MVVPKPAGPAPTAKASGKFAEKSSALFFFGELSVRTPENHNLMPSTPCQAPAKGRTVSTPPSDFGWLLVAEAGEAPWWGRAVNPEP